MSPSHLLMRRFPAIKLSSKKNQLPKIGKALRSGQEVDADGSVYRIPA